LRQSQPVSTLQRKVTAGAERVCCARQFGLEDCRLASAVLETRVKDGNKGDFAVAVETTASITGSPKPWRIIISEAGMLPHWELTK
jgi:hypothetical protein